jgi:hypothetical protein
MAGLGKEQQGGQDSGLKQGQEHTGNLGLATRPGGKASGLDLKVRRLPGPVAWNKAS